MKPCWIALLLLAAAFGSNHVRAQDRTILVFAAASLKDALDDINAAHARATRTKVRASYAATSQLIKQIEQGAPADVFIAADLEWMNYGAQKQVLNDATRVQLLGNRLVLIAPLDARHEPVTVTPGFPLAALAGENRIVTGDVQSVPVGRYAKAALERLGLWKAVQPKLAMVENVRAALALVARGEAPLGIVYETDAKAEPKVKVVGSFPADSHPPIVYPAALTARAGAGAAEYLAFLQSPAAKQIFESRGFVFLPKGAS